MPLPMVEADLNSGTLVPLAMPEHPRGPYRFSGIWRRDAPPGPAATWLLGQFITTAPQTPEHPDAGGKWRAWSNFQSDEIL